MHQRVAWKEWYNLDTDLNIKKKKKNQVQNTLLVFYTKATTKANTSLLVGSTQWLWYLHSVRLGRKSQSPGGMYLPHLIHESSRMKGSQWQKFMLPHYVPHKHLWVKAPWCSPQQDDTRSITMLAAFPPSSALLPPSPKPPQTNPWLHSSTLFRHNPQAPRSTTCVYRIRACGFTTKTQHEDTSLACTVAPGELGLEELSDGGWGWPLVVMPWRSWLRPEQLFLVWELATGKIGWVQIWLPAHGLTGWWWKAMPSVSLSK